MDAVGDAGDLLADAVDGGGRPAFRRGDAFRQALGDAGDLAAQLFQGFGLGVVGPAQALLDGRAHAGDFRPDLGDGVRPAVLDLEHLAVHLIGDPHDFLAQFLAHHGHGLALAAFAGRQVSGDLVKRPFQSPQGFDLAVRGRAGAALLHRAQPLGHAGLVRLQVGEGVFESRRHLGLVLDGGVEALRQVLQRRQHPLQVVAAAARRAVFARRTITRRGRPQRRRPGRRLGVVVIDDLIEPLAQGHARAARKILGDLARFRINALNRPGRP